MKSEFFMSSDSNNSEDHGSDQRDTTPDVFEAYKKEVDESIKKVNDRMKEEKETRKYTDYDNYPIEMIRKETQEIIQNTCDIPESIAQQIELDIPPPQIIGDFSLNAFVIAKKIGSINPNELAEKIAEAINSNDSKFILRADATGAFVNIEVKRENVYAETLSNISALGEKYGESDINARKTALIDYSAPNIVKPIGVGHLRSTIIGQALSNIYEKTGFSVIKDNHLGDWGTQFGKLIYAYENFGDKEKISQNPIHELKELYVQFHQKAEENPEMEDRARELFTRLEQKDPSIAMLWKKFRDLSIIDFEKIYKRLGIKFDTYIGESYFADQTNNVIEDCLNKNIGKKDPDTDLVLVESLKGLPSFLLRKQDGSSLYLSRDLATLKFRVQNFLPDSIVYVVGSEQELNFKQLFELAKATEYLPSNIEAKHIGFGMVLKEGKKMSTRKGTLIELEELINQSIDKSKEILLQKNPDITADKLNELSEIIGIGAILYNDLRQSRMKNISFDWEQMLNFESGSAAYLQYTYARVQSILRKIEGSSEKGVEAQPNEISSASFQNESEFILAKKLMFFPSIILKAQKTDSPHLISSYMEEVAHFFNAFYHDVSVIKTENAALHKSRITLIKAVASVIKNGLALLNIKVPSRM